jgi:hypothetical protein
MPKKAHEALEKNADRMKLTGERRKRYIYGTLAKIKKGRK